MVGCATTVGTCETGARVDSAPLLLTTAYAMRMTPGDPCWSRVWPTSRLGSGSVWPGRTYGVGTTWMLVATRTTVTKGLSTGITESTGGSVVSWGPSTTL